MIEEKIKQEIPLAPMTTFKIGGSAKFYVEVASKEELAEAVKWGNKNCRGCFILGGGSNVLVNDKGVDGLVIKIANNSFSHNGEKSVCGAGMPLAKAVTNATNNSLSGLEWAAGIPGTIGGAIRGNAGAFGSHISDITETVEIYNQLNGNFEMLSKKECNFSYRESIFKEDKNLIIWEATLNLQQKNLDEIKKSIEEYISHRQKTQPKLPSAGSVFKGVLLKDLENSNKNLAGMAEKSGIIKNEMISAGWIIELLGLKGKTVGGAKISLEHANFIVNTGKATAEDIIMLISLIKQQARDKFGLQLFEEIQYFGM